MNMASIESRIARGRRQREIVIPNEEDTPDPKNLQRWTTHDTTALIVFAVVIVFVALVCVTNGCFE